MHAAREKGSAHGHFARQVLLDYCQTVLHPEHLRLLAAMADYAEYLQQPAPAQSKAA